MVFYSPTLWYACFQHFAPLNIAPWGSSCHLLHWDQNIYRMGTSQISQSPLENTRKKTGKGEQLLPGTNFLSLFDQIYSTECPRSCWLLFPHMGSHFLESAPNLNPGHKWRFDSKVPFWLTSDTSFILEGRDRIGGRTCSNQICFVSE